MFLLKEDYEARGLGKSNDFYQHFKASAAATQQTPFGLLNCRYDFDKARGFPACATRKRERRVRPAGWRPCRLV
jgi:hypothetical protein